MLGKFLLIPPPCLNHSPCGHNVGEIGEVSKVDTSSESLLRYIQPPGAKGTWAIQSSALLSMSWFFSLQQCDSKFERRNSASPLLLLTRTSSRHPLPVFLNLLSEPCFPVQFHNQAFGFYASLPEGKRTRQKEGCRTQARREGRRSLGRASWPGRCSPLRVGVSPPASCSPPLVLKWCVESGFLMEWNRIEGKY